MRWNNGVSFPIQSGHGCFGCSEENYWDNGRIYERASAFPGFGIEADADKVGMVALGVTAGALAAHAVATNLRKHKLVSHLEKEGKQSEKDLE
jgi:hydrogenase small subunit